MNVKMKSVVLIGVLLGAVATNSLYAHEEGDWLFRFGGSYIDPKSNNHEVVSVDSALGVTFNLSYMMTDNWSVELLAALPYKHDIELLNGDKVGSTKHLPPTVSLQYHFAPQAKIQPYVGLGVNYTLFFSEKTQGALEGADLDLGRSWGIAGELGVDIPLNEKWFLNLDARYINIETKAKLDGADLGKVKISPMVYGVHVGLKF